MTIRQKVTKFFYPFFHFITLKLEKNIKQLNSTTMAPISFYNLAITLNNGKIFNFSELKNRKVMIVNTASDCGYTNQYDGLQALQEKYKDSLQIIGFPSNDFGAQEKGSDDTIANFCKINFGVTFPLAKKATVRKKPDQQEVYKWLSDENKNGWNSVAPSWNFCKYIIDEEGHLTHYFEASIEPMGKEIEEAITVKN